MIVKEEFLSKLRRYFSLNLYEVKIWTALLSRGVSTAGELSDIANVPRSRSYDVLESLEKPTTQEELAELYDDYSPLIRRILAYFLATGEKMTHAVENELRRILEEHSPQDIENLYALITTPVKHDLLYQELKDWMDVANNPIKEKILEQSSFCWMMPSRE